MRSSAEIGVELTRIAHSLTDVTALLAAVDEPIRVAPVDTDDVTPTTVAAVQSVLDRLTGQLDLSTPRVVPDSACLWSAELAVSDHIGLGALADQAEALLSLPDGVFDQLTEQASRAARTARRAGVWLRASDGAPLRCYSSGSPSRPTVVLVPACGMPVGLIERWIQCLATSFHVLTWESRGLFGTDEMFDQRGQDLARQADDVFAMLDGFGVRRAHVMGLCGGAAIALAAAASPRIISVSLWHGDYELGDQAPKTAHQQDVAALMTLAGRDRSRAAALHNLFRKPATLAKLRRDVAHLQLYPYVSPELLYRYGRLNGAIMTTDCRPLLAAVTQPTLVVTSMLDTTAHPDGSVYAARQLLNADLRLMPDGDHLAAFDAAPPLVELAQAFVTEHSAGGTP
ncbi:MAG TPA: alpha/beta hydrolase [Pseudonocardiaceae bacterium]|nr:alpha/beta hydrolase [Pseudonocardiaceae bacterium]